MFLHSRRSQILAGLFQYSYQPTVTTNTKGTYSSNLVRQYAAVRFRPGFSTIGGPDENWSTTRLLHQYNKAAVKQTHDARLRNMLIWLYTIDNLRFSWRPRRLYHLHVSCPKCPVLILGLFPFVVFSMRSISRPHSKSRGVKCGNMLLI